MPTVTDPADINRLLPEEPADDVIFQMIRDGQTWHHRLPTCPEHQVRVRVLNGTGIAGLARQTARRLARLGFDVTGTGDAPATSATTVTYSGTAQADSAYTLMTALKATPAAQNLLAEPAPQTGQPGPVTLVIGSDFTGVNAPAAPHRARPATPRRRGGYRRPGHGAEPQRWRQHLLWAARGEPGSRHSLSPQPTVP